jgi:NADPH:quinone reductase-like Zn-dependent oxidoreductase
MCVDYVGESTWGRSVRSLARGGRLVTCGATTGYNASTDLRHVFYKQLEIIGSTMGTKGELLAPLRLVFQGKIRPVVGKVFDLKDAADAHRLMEGRGAVGKIVLRVAGG